MERDDLAARIEVAALAPGTAQEDVRAACRTARDLGCAVVCVAPAWVADAAAALRGSGVAVGGVVGFPLGATTALAKVFEALECVKAGADHLDVVLHVGAARSGRYAALRGEARELMRRTPEAVHKFILEVSLLQPAQLRRAVKAVCAADPEFVKTSTGFTGVPVTPEDVARLRGLLPASVRIKAAGGIRTRALAEALIRAGADRIGTSSPRQVLAGEPGPDR